MGTHLHQVQNWPELAEKANWSVAALAKASGASVRMLERYFLKNEGKPPKAWLREQRQRRAMAYLREGYSVKETAMALGYRSVDHFSHDFKDYCGLCPSGQRPSNRLATGIVAF